ncbi:MAG: universal stress protein [Bacteroidales bacterium]
MEDRIITITSCPYSRAQLIKGRLESEGIECFLSNINLVQPGVSTGVKVRINEKDADQAFRIIEEMKNQYGEGKTAVLDQIKAIRRILVPVDFSDNTDNICNYALGIAHQLKAEIRLIYSYFNPVISTDPYLESQSYNFQMENIMVSIEKEAREEMKQLKIRIREQIDKEKLTQIKKVTYNLEVGIAETVILDQIDKFKPGLVVMGTKGKGMGISDYIGGVTKKIIDKSTVPVLAIPDKSTYWGIQQVNRVLYATNFDESDYKTLRQLMTMVRPFHMEIFYVHIYSGDTDPFNHLKMEKLRTHFTEHYSDYKITCDMLMHRDTVEGLEEYIKEKDIDLIALTTRKRGIIERLFNPSLAKKMLYHTNVPLLVFQS